MVSDVIIGILITGIFTLGGALTGSVIAPKLNHKYRMQQIREEHNKKIDFMKKELFFKKKLKYFEEISNMIDQYVMNARSTVIEFMKDEPNIKGLIKMPKIEIMEKNSISLYDDDISKILENQIKFSDSIIDFGEASMSYAKEVLKTGMKGKRNKFLTEVEKANKRLISAGAEVSAALRKELQR